MNKKISTPSRTKEILETYGLKAKKNFGQNFLVDPIITERSAELVSDGAVIEIGPGLGSLTEELSNHCESVVAYEIDEDMVNVLNDLLKDRDNIEIINEDILESNIEEKAKELYKKYGKVHVCANLPYYITSPVLFKLFRIKEIEKIIVMVQKEVGERFVAKAKDKEYSSLSVEGQILYDIKRIFTVPARSFNPSPKVDSVVIGFTRKDKEIKDLDKLYDFIRLCFKQRRKTIYNNLKEEFVEDEIKKYLECANISEGKRAQELSVEEIENLYNIVYER